MKLRSATSILAMVTWAPLTGYAGISVEPAGMKIIWNAMQEEFDGFQTFNSAEGLHLCLGLRSTDKGFIDFDKDKSSVTISDSGAGFEAEFGHWTKISKDTKSMRIELSSERLPAPNTSKLKITGDLVLTVASEKTTKTTELREFKKGDKIKSIEGFDFEIESIGEAKKDRFSKHEAEITLKWMRKVPELAEVRYYDKAGAIIESSSGGSSSMGFAGRYTVSKTYRLKKNPDKFTIEFDLWTGLETVTIPVNLETGIGGGK